MGLGRRGIRTALPCLILLPSLALTQSGEPADCYQTRVGAWAPTPRPDQVRFLQVPERVQTSEQVGRAGPELGKTLVRPTQDLNGRISWAFWRMTDDAKMEITYINDFGSIHLKLSKRNWGWIGDGVAQFEPAGSFRAPVRFVPIPCV